MPVDGAPAPRISGAVFGAISTLGEYENYHLRLQFKWGERRFPPRTTSRRDSGVLYHSVGPHAAGWFFWMRSQEFQVQEHDTGDYWAVGGAAISAHVQAVPIGEKTDFVYSPKGEYTTFHSGAKAGGHIRGRQDAERERGQWNTLDLYCLGPTSMHVVNGILVAVLHDSAQPDGKGGHVPLTKGRIQLQSEGAEIYFRDLTLEPIQALPPQDENDRNATATAR